MLKKFYVQTEKPSNKITDIIEFAYSDYKEITAETPLPYNVLGGAYQLLDNNIIYKPEWDIPLQKLKSELEITQASLDELILNGGIL